jgi:hypothetical protein
MLANILGLPDEIKNRSSLEIHDKVDFEGFEIKKGEILCGVKLVLGVSGQ